jgi:hypothetical protein
MTMDDKPLLRRPVVVQGAEPKSISDIVVGMKKKESVELRELAKKLKTNHRQVAGALAHAIKHAMDAGDKLISQKETHPDMSDRTARLYMQLARERERIEAEWQTMGCSADFVHYAVNWLAPSFIWFTRRKRFDEIARRFDAVRAA